MAQIIPKITIRSVNFGMLLLSAVVMILAVRLTVASDLDSLIAAAEQGDGAAQFNLGNMYADGRGVPQNDAEAVRWYRMAAEQGVARAQFNLGYMYAEGHGVPKNDAEAVRWYRMAAEQGVARAQFNLGIRYADGRSVPQNDAEAVRWYRMAAEQGFARVGAVQSGCRVCRRSRRSQKRCRGGAMVSHGRRAGICRGAAQSGLHVWHRRRHSQRLRTGLCLV